MLPRYVASVYVALLLGCSPDLPTDEADMDQGEIVATPNVPGPSSLSPSCSIRQSVPLPSPQENDARFGQFLLRNGGTWMPAVAWAFDSLTGSIAFAYRTGARGPKLTTLPTSQALTTARDFILLNWDLLGYRSKAGAAGASFTAESVTPAYAGGGIAWRVVVESDESQVGYEHLAGTTQHLFFALDIREDGVLDGFTSANELRVPTLTLDPKPHADEATARQQVLGLPMIRPYAAYEDHWATGVNYGPVTAADIVKTSLTVEREQSSSSASFFLAYEVIVSHQDYRGRFVVDACTGQLIPG